MRAVRGIGQAMEAQRGAGLMAKGGNPEGVNQYENTKIHMNEKNPAQGRVFFCRC
jgi:hypothetical protein